MTTEELVDALVEAVSRGRDGDDGEVVGRRQLERRTQGRRPRHDDGRREEAQECRDRNYWRGTTGGAAPVACGLQEVDPPKTPWWFRDAALSRVVPVVIVPTMIIKANNQ